jgi:chromate reductase
MKTYQIGVLVGSLRKASWSLMIAKKLIALAPPSLQMEVLEIGQLPLFNQDYEENNNTPESYILFRNKLKPLDGVLFVTPEYNRSVSAVLKNAIDVGSRPYGQSSWEGKPGAVISSSPGAIGGFGANHHLRQSLAFLNVPCLPMEAYISNVAPLFDDKGNLTNKSTQAFFEKFINAYAAWVAKLA